MTSGARTVQTRAQFLRDIPIHESRTRVQRVGTKLTGDSRTMGI